MAFDHHKTELEAAMQNAEAEVYVLRLFVAGSTPRSLRAIANIRAVCEQYLQGRYELEVFDVYQRPELAESEQIVAVPTLIKKLPLPLRQMVGDLSDIERVLTGLDLRPRG
jgi:circadian clock protein KaiB